MELINRLRRKWSIIRYGDISRHDWALQFGYPKEYRVKSVTEQVNILHKFFPNIDCTDENIAQKPLPKGAEGQFVIPKWNKLAKTYNEAVMMVLDSIKRQRKFYCGIDLGKKYLRQHERTAKRLQILGKQYKEHDILVIPAQFGLRYRDWQVRQAREAFALNEFGLGTFEVGCMLLTHPERIVANANINDDLPYNLPVCCPGDEYCPHPLNEIRFFDAVTFFDFGFNALELSYVEDMLSRRINSSPSGFIP